jgi:plastocyanin
MKLSFIAGFTGSWLLLTIATYGGTITGTVRAQGVQPDDGSGGGNYSSRRYKFAEKIDYDDIRDFVVYIDQPFPGATFTPPAEPAKIVQKDVAFAPHVLPVLVGTTVLFPNQDEIYHNVFSVSPAKSFDLDLYKGEQPAKSEVFDKPGMVDVFCAIHSKMHCIVLVLENPYFAATDEHRRFTIRNVPAGIYKLRAWHERIPSQVREITVPADGEVKVDFVLGFNASRKP